MIALAPHAVVPRQGAPSAPRQFVVFTLAGEAYALPVRHVREVIRPQKITRLPKAAAFIEGVLNLRGRVVAVVDLRRRMELPVGQAQSTRVVIARAPHALVGLIVDTVREVIHIADSAVQSTPQVLSGQLAAAYSSGIARIENQLIVLLDLDALFSAEESNHLAQLQAGPPKGNAHG